MAGKGFDFSELYVVVEDWGILWAECLYDRITATEIAERHGHEVRSLEEWLFFLKWGCYK